MAILRILRIADHPTAVRNSAGSSTLGDNAGADAW
jgi:hypothetical protein